MEMIWIFSILFLITAYTPDCSGSGWWLTAYPALLSPFTNSHISIIFQSWNHICLNNNWSDFSQSVANKISLVTKVFCSYDGCTMRRLNFYHFWYAQSTIFQALCQGACSSTVTYQCVRHVVNWSCADKCTLCMAHNKIGCRHWDNYHFFGVPSFQLSQLNDVGNIVGRFRQLWIAIQLFGGHWRGYHNLFGHQIWAWPTSSSAAHTTEPTG